MEEIKVSCAGCGQHFLVEQQQIEALTCPKCGGNEFSRLDARAAAASGAGSEKTVVVPPSSPSSPSPTGPADIRDISAMYSAIATELEKVIVGQQAVVEEVLVALLCNGHCLLEGVPGLAKTLLISSLAKALHLTFKRIQFTPDLMPSDITGTEIIQEDPVTRERQFKFLPGPVFANIILADEINRTPPKTQAALLEAMQEKQVSIGGVIHPLDLPFFILATQNPLEQEGTYPLPEAQQDRFLFKIYVDYPELDDETEIVRRVSEQRFGVINPVCQGTTLLAMQKTIRDIPVADAVIDYANRLVRATRIGRDTALDFANEWLAWGAGPRATIYLVMAAKCFCALAGNPTPSCDDIGRAALPVLRHRIALNYTGKAEGLTTDDVVRKLLERVAKY
jgi:MoxR-like ATPase